MTPAQTIWWRQAKSDFEIFEKLRIFGSPECHLLHYLQMSTEKLSKSYLWDSRSQPTKSHKGFATFLRALAVQRADRLSRTSNLLGFNTPTGFDYWIKHSLPLAYAIQQLAPSLANDGPNPEYPWPHTNPSVAPADYSFPVWRELRDTADGRRLLQVTKTVIYSFDQIA